jgi:hypothetical protein
VSHSREAGLWNDINVNKESITIRIETAQAVGSTEVLGVWVPTVVPPLVDDAQRNKSC